MRIIMHKPLAVSIIFAACGFFQAFYPVKMPLYPINKKLGTFYYYTVKRVFCDAFCTAKAPCPRKIFFGIYTRVRIALI